MTATTEAPTLAERLEAARAAEAAPRKRVGEIRTALRAAGERRDFDEAARLERELQPAEEALAFASAVVTALDAQAAAIERDRQEREAARVKAEQRDRAQEVIGQAIEAEQAAHGEIRSHVAAMYEHIEAARDSFAAAQEAERAVAAAQQRAINARVTADEGAPRRAPGANTASVLAERDDLVRELVKWGGPPAQPARRPVITTSAPPQGGRGLTQRSPW